MRRLNARRIAVSRSDIPTTSSGVARFRATPSVFVGIGEGPDERRWTAIYITKDTPLPAFIPLPLFLVGSRLTLNAKLLYGLLLNRTQLSRKNGWVSDAGHVYVIYPIRQMANDLGRSERTVQTALRELEDAELLTRRRQGFKKASLLYLLLPDDAQLLTGHDTQNTAGHDTREIAGHDTQNLPTSNTDRKYKDIRRKKAEGTRRCLGTFENVFLSENEYSALQTDFPDRYGDYIDRLSRYMAANDRHYANHYAVLLKWLDEDGRGKFAQSYSYEDQEGDCL